MDAFGYLSLGERLTRLLGSWVGLTVMFLAGLLSLAGAAVVVDVQMERQALADVRKDGRLVAGLLTHGEFTEAQAATGVPRATQERVRSRVNGLRRQGQIIGFQLWTTAGVQLFAEPASNQSLSADIVSEVRQGRDLVEVDEQHGRLRSDDVLVRVDLDADHGTDLVAVVLLPRNRLDALRSTAQTRIGWGGAVLAILLGTALALARRRQLRREHLARHDPLTGLGNRSLLAEAAHRRGQGPYALLLMDLDGFKSVNDTLGHAAGDELLIQVADALRQGVRHGDLVVRLGGDEFAILLDGIDEPDQAVHVAVGVVDKLTSTGFTVRGIDLDVHASVGVAVNGRGGFGASTLLRQSDVAMYRAKETGTGVVLYNADHDHHDTDRLAMLGELRRAITQGELILHYQPLVPALAAYQTPGLDGTGVVSVEALVRWEHPLRGLLAPDDFIPVAERTGVIHALTAWVLDQAVAQAASWRRTGLDLTVSVNLSPRAVNRGLVSLVLTTLDRHSVPASRLKLEITETAVAEDPTSTIAVLRELHAAGIQISLDDFGAGYTSLAYLTALPLTELKIDRSFVEAVTQHADTTAVVNALIELGHRLGLSVVAEGVETEDTSRELIALGCDYIQGFLYSRPLAAEQIQPWMAARQDHHELPTWS